MLDPAIRDQLASHFASLSARLTLAVRPSTHPKQSELLALLGDLASISDKVTVLESGAVLDHLHFEILRDGMPLGMHFKGIPGGHEFTSLILALLHADGKGRWPDEALKARVRALRGPIHLRTFISLSCTNCPDVVQALNQMALLHDDFSHTMVDGELQPDEVARLGIQGVPAVFDGDALVHVGKASFGELLEALEARFGVHHEAAAEATASREAWEVLVIGGGPAGAAAAIYSARKGLRTGLVAQKTGGQVNDTLAIENLISVPHTEGPRLAASLADHLGRYRIDLLEHRRVESVVDGALKEVRLQGGEILRAQQVIVASGAKWRELGIPGEKDYTGKGVAFCPHCDGPFFAGKRVAVVGGGNSGVEAAIDLAGICASVLLVEFAPELKADRVLIEKLHSLSNVRVLLHTRSTEVLGDGTRVTGLRLEDRSSGSMSDEALEGIFVQIGLLPNSGMVKDLVETNRMGEIIVDGHCRTNVPGIYAAGDVTTVPYKQIVIAMGEGAKAALSAFEDRMRGAVEALPQSVSA